MPQLKIQEVLDYAEALERRVAVLEAAIAAGGNISAEDLKLVTERAPVADETAKRLEGKIDTLRMDVAQHVKDYVKQHERLRHS